PPTREPRRAMRAARRRLPVGRPRFGRAARALSRRARRRLRARAPRRRGRERGRRVARTPRRRAHARRAAPRRRRDPRPRPPPRALGALLDLAAGDLGDAIVRAEHAGLVRRGGPSPHGGTVDLYHDGVRRAALEALAPADLADAHAAWVDRHGPVLPPERRV